jgi:peptidoglycan/LPS O-acetylase OafA/YrhL
MQKFEMPHLYHSRFYCANYCSFAPSYSPEQGSVQKLTDNRIYGLDGLRFFAFVFVIYNHFFTVLESYGYAFREPPWIDALGHYGLQYFFCGSGFLITTMLLRERQKTGGFRMGYFYLRRIVRIWPAYFVLVAVVYLLVYHTDFFYLNGMSGQFAPYSGKALLLFLLVMPHLNEFIFPTAPYLHHTYTIGIEEQFYLVWALVFRFLHRRFLPAIKLMLLLGIVFNLAHYFFYASLQAAGLGIVNKIAVYYDYSQITTFCIGSYLAIYFRSGHRSLTLFQNRGVQIAFYILFAVLVYTNLRLPLLTNECMSLVVCCILLFATYKKTSVINYSYGLWEFLGKISYGVYLFHYIALVTVLHLFVFNWHANLHNPYIFALAAVAVLLGSILPGIISYYTVETLFMKLKDRFAVKPPASS